MMGFSVTRALSGAALAATMVFAIGTAGNEHTLCQGFLPENNMYIPEGLFASGGITEQQFNDVLDRLQTEFGPDVAKLGDTLQINRYWSNGTVNASAMRLRTTEVINMYGGLARHPATTVDGFALVACHEYGHHHGGAPKRNIPFMDPWATNEGGADYYASLKCLRRMFANDDNVSIVANLPIDPVAENACRTQYTDVKDQALCIRIALAGQSVTDLLQDVKKEPVRASFGTPDPSVVTRIDDNHPKGQCRLDTIFAGALCTVAVGDELSNTNYQTGSCYAPRDTVGTRPLCWFYAK